MRCLKMIAVILVPLMLSLTGCGSDSSGTTSANNPFTTSGGNTSGDGTSPPTPTGSGTVLSYNLVLSLISPSGTGTTVGPNSKVIATAILTDSSGNPVANQPIKFEAVEGPVAIDPAIVTTDSSGKAINLLTAGATTTSAIDVIMKASTSVNSQLVTAIGMFKIMRSESNIIKFMTTKGPTDPDGTLNTLRVTLTNASTPSSRTILQQVPFQILDNNGVPRVRVPVTISIYSEIGDCPVFIDSPEAAARTVTTDDTGLGIFNAGVTVVVPPVGSENACSIIYKAEAVDPNNPPATIYSYGGFIAVLENVLPE
ncbi:MAG: Ig-like domain-containing protein [Geobacteraceae bacterium]|nr:Ig-like domain-containing protein [Geobacteraceae bacterium]